MSAYRCASLLFVGTYIQTREPCNSTAAVGATAAAAAAASFNSVGSARPLTATPHGRDRCVRWDLSVSQSVRRLYLPCNSSGHAAHSVRLRPTRLRRRTSAARSARSRKRADECTGVFLWCGSGRRSRDRANQQYTTLRSYPRCGPVEGEVRGEGEE